MHSELQLKYLELCNEELHDLLAVQGSAVQAPAATQAAAHATDGVSVRVAPSGEVCIEGARELLLRSPSHLLQLVAEGNAARTGVGPTSSRPHALLVLSLEQQLPPDSRTGEAELRSSKLRVLELTGGPEWLHLAGVTLPGSHSRREEADSAGQERMHLSHGAEGLEGAARLGAEELVPRCEFKLALLLQVRWAELSQLMLEGWVRLVARAASCQGWDTQAVHIWLETSCCSAQPCIRDTEDLIKGM